jgi:hypothetical protein
MLAVHTHRYEHLAKTGFVMLGVAPQMNNN